MRCTVALLAMCVFVAVNAEGVSFPVHRVLQYERDGTALGCHAVPVNLKAVSWSSAVRDGRGTNARSIVVFLYNVSAPTWDFSVHRLVFTLFVFTLFISILDLVSLLLTPLAPSLCPRTQRVLRADRTAGAGRGSALDPGGCGGHRVPGFA